MNGKKKIGKTENKHTNVNKPSIIFLFVWADSQGVYDDVACTSDIVNHAILIVGYTPNEWILKNWWGEHWGEGGYMRLARHKNRCGIANYAAYAKIE
ncbi:hypothetical protein HZH68_014436 [Vespula germanica]|uniref:Peptidase C1A papain C-terminal domain-containing protein n=1 Tax=Vespula germanica TaxID=30212 RepID=A0A834JCZ3_VESGE|nr:hypothetical protein HZH68_014436 [Vespula germanica]